MLVKLLVRYCVSASSYISKIPSTLILLIVTLVASHKSPKWVLVLPSWLKH